MLKTITTVRAASGTPPLQTFQTSQTASKPQEPKFGFAYLDNRRKGWNPLIRRGDVDDREARVLRR